MSLATRARLEAAIKMHGYRANASARALAHGRTNTIGLLIPPQGSTLSSFAVEFISCVVQNAQAADYDVLVSTSLEERQVFARLIEEQRVDGVILLEVSLEDQRVDRLQAAGVPFVTVGRTAHTDGYTWVDIDFEALAGPLYATWLTYVIGASSCSTPRKNSTPAVSVRRAALQDGF